HTTIDPSGAPVMSASGFAHTLQTFDRQHNLIQVEHRDAAEHLTSKRSQCARRKFTFDQYRNLLVEECFDNAEKPRLNDDGVFRTVHQYDARGLELNRRLFGVLSQPVLSKELGCHGVDFSYDVHGNTERSSYLGQDGKPIVAGEGVAVRERRYLGYDRLGEEYGFDTDGRKVRFREGFHREVREYDASGRLIKRRYLGEHDEPVLHENGYAEIQYIYHATSNNRSASVRSGDSDGEDELRYLGTHGELVRSRFGYARRETVYSPDGLIKTQAYFGQDGLLIANREGYARVEKEYTREVGQRTITTRLFSPEGRPVLGQRDGAQFATMKVTVNAFGLATDVSYEMPSGQPAPQSNGCSALKLAYDTRGNLVETQCYLGTSKAFFRAVEGTLGGYHALHAEYDPQGNVLFLETLGRDGALTVNGSRFARQNFSYDSSGRLVSLWNSDTEQHAIESREGWARRELRYDEFGNVVQESYYGADTKLKAVNGVARHVASYDESGHLLSASRFDAGNKELSTVRYEYDRRGLLHMQKAERDGKPIAIPGTGWYRSEFRYDPWGRLLVQLNYGANDKPSASCAAVHISYNADGTSKQTCGAFPPDTSVP
ncbi:MAG TPA: hypothetical protein VN764_09365, partial [Polyangiaceae bacterium]|nr:hypothetical protein [Polyangiaceae bacterium]